MPVWVMLQALGGNCPDSGQFIFQMSAFQFVSKLFNKIYLIIGLKELLTTNYQLNIKCLQNVKHCRIIQIYAKFRDDDVVYAISKK